eukprot:gene32110-39658_t
MVKFCDLEQHKNQCALIGGTDKLLAVICKQQSCLKTWADDVAENAGELQGEIDYLRQQLASAQDTTKIAEKRADDAEARILELTHEPDMPHTTAESNSFDDGDLGDVKDTGFCLSEDSVLQ